MLRSGVKVYYLPLLPVYNGTSLPTLYASLGLVREVLVRESIELVLGDPHAREQGDLLDGISVQRWGIPCPRQSSGGNGGPEPSIRNMAVQVGPTA